MNDDAILRVPVELRLEFVFVTIAGMKVLDAKWKLPDHVVQQLKRPKKIPIYRRPDLHANQLFADKRGASEGALIDLRHAA